MILLVRVGYQKKGNATTTPATQPTAASASATKPTSQPYYGPYIMSPEDRASVLAGV